MSTNIKYVETLTPEKRQAIIKNSVMAMPNSVVSNPTELKKAFVKPIVNDDGTPCIADEIDRIAEQTNAGFEAMDNNKVNKSGDTMTGSLTVGYVGEGENEDKTRAARMSGESGVFEVLDGKNKTEYNNGYIREFHNGKESSFLFPSSSGILARLEDVNKSKTELSETIDNVKQELSEDIDNVKQELSEDIAELDYANKIDLLVDPQTYVMTVTLKNPNGETVSESTVDLPFESVVVGGKFDEDTSEIVLTLKNGNEIRFPASNIVGGFISDKEFEVFLATKGQPNGFAGLDANGKVPKEQLPAGSGGDGISATEFEELLIESLTNPTEEWMDEEKAAACETIGAVEAIKESEITGNNYLYGTDKKGNRTLYKVLDGIGANFIPIRNVWGGLDVPEPQRDNHATPKSYVDGLRVEIVQDVIESGKGEIVQAIIEELQGLPVFGVVDENNTITITSQLSSGTYTLKYENADGTTTEIGTIVIGSGEPEGGNTYEVDIASIGYTDNARWSITDGTIRTGASGYTAINKIPFARTSEQTVSITLSGITWTDSALPTQYAAILLYSGDSYTSGNNMYMKSIPHYFDDIGLSGKLNDNGTITFTITNGTKGVMFDGFKLCGYGIGANAKVTITIE